MALKTVVSVVAFLSSAAMAHSVADLATMGPIGFMWPPDRPWDGDLVGMRGPCGSNVTGPTNWTEFPLVGGALALEQKQEVFDLQVSISFDSDPTTTSFVAYTAAGRLGYLNFAHVCINLTEPIPSGAGAGRNATLQLRYTAEWIDPNHTHGRRRATGLSGPGALERRHTPVNATFYACADVTLVPREVFTYSIPCFNATGSHGSSSDDGSGHFHGGGGSGSGQGSSSAQGGGSSGLSGQAIAGVVVGVVVGVGLLVSVGWYLWRRDRREKMVAQHIMNTEREK